MQKLHKEMKLLYSVCLLRVYNTHHEEIRGNFAFAYLGIVCNSSFKI